MRYLVLTRIYACDILCPDTCGNARTRRRKNEYARGQEAHGGQAHLRGTDVEGAGHESFHVLQEDAEQRRRVQRAGPDGLQARAGDGRKGRG